MSKCLYCYGELEEGQRHFHPACARHFFGVATPPILPYTRDDMSELARKVIRASTTVTGVQEKMSLDIDRGKKNEAAKFTIVGLWGKYIFKPQSSRYKCLPELEDLTLKMAAAAGIKTVEHTLIPMADGELGFLTKRLDRDSEGKKVSMLDMCQLSNRLTEHKYSRHLSAACRNHPALFIGSAPGCPAFLGNRAVLLDDREYRYALQKLLPD